MPPLRVLQVSDLHAGTREAEGLQPQLRSAVAELEPELVIATGDITHRNMPPQHDEAAALLRSLGPPLLVIPGNHDMPMLPPQRFTHTFSQFRRIWSETEPVYRSEQLVVSGLNSARPWKQQGGALRRSQLERVARLFQEASPRALKIVALHHHLLGAPWRTAKRSIASRSRVLGALVDAGAELIVSGHVHQSAVGERREFEVVRSPTGVTVVASAPGLGRPRAWRRGEALGFHLYEAEANTIRVLTYAWQENGWRLMADRRYPRRFESLAPPA